MSRAACGDLDPELFYPPFTRSGVDWSAPRRVCGRCQVAMRCLLWALDGEPLPRYGMWGGLTPQERESLAERLSTP